MVDTLRQSRKDAQRKKGEAIAREMVYRECMLCCESLKLFVVHQKMGTTALVQVRCGWYRNSRIAAQDGIFFRPVQLQSGDYTDASNARSGSRRLRCKKEKERRRIVDLSRTEGKMENSV